MGGNVRVATLRLVVRGEVVREDGTKAAPPVKPDTRRKTPADNFIIVVVLVILFYF